MIDDLALTDPAQAPPPDAARNGAEGRVQALEERVRRLEEVVGRLQDVRVPEPPAAVPIPSALPASADSSAGAVRASAGVLLEAGRTLLPAAGAVLAATAAVAEAQARAQVGAAPRQPSWLLVDVYAEARALLRMYLDRRFRLTWQARLLPLILVAAIATSWIWLPGAEIFNKVTLGIGGTLYVKVIDLVLAFVLFKVLHREVSRYRSTSLDLPPSLRL